MTAGRWIFVNHKHHDYASTAFKQGHMLHAIGGENKAVENEYMYIVKSVFGNVQNAEILLENVQFAENEHENILNVKVVPENVQNTKDLKIQ